MWYGAIMDAFGTMLTGENRVIGVTDVPPNMSGDLIEIALYEKPLRAAMFRYGINILLLSIFLSLLVAGMIFAALNWVLVKPMQRLTRNMVGFGQNPEDFSRIISPSARRDEIGIAERECAICNRSSPPCCSRKTSCGLGLCGQQGQPRFAQHADLGPVDL